MLLSPVPDWIISKVWGMPPDEVPLERAKARSIQAKIKLSETNLCLERRRR
jgi:hypothetical protein